MNKHLQDELVGAGYPHPGLPKNRAHWIPFPPKPDPLQPNFDDPACLSWLFCERGLPLLLIIPNEERFEHLWKDPEVFERPCPFLLRYKNAAVETVPLVGVNTVPLTSFAEIKDYPSGMLSRERASLEVSVIGERFSKLLETDAVRAMAQGLLRIHVRPSLVIAELIQNALDCGADDMRFDLHDDPPLLHFSHNGAPFTARDVYALTAFNVSSKPPGSIGFMGIGFKSVFRVSQRPEVHSGPFHFAFEPHPDFWRSSEQGELCPYIPRPVLRNPMALDERTAFDIPLRPQTVDLIQAGLQGIAPVLLFLLRQTGINVRKLVTPYAEMAVNEAGELLVDGHQEKWLGGQSTFRVLDHVDQWKEFLSITGRQIDPDQDHTESVSVALAGHGDNEPSGRVHVFLPTSETLDEPLQIQGNFATTSDRNHLTGIESGSWNELLLVHAGKALACALNSVVDDHVSGSSDWTRYYLAIPAWTEQFPKKGSGSLYQCIHQGFSGEFPKKPRIPVDIATGKVQFVGPESAVLIDPRLRPCLTTEQWCQLLDGNKFPVSESLPSSWTDFLASSVSPPLPSFGNAEMLAVVRDPLWFEKLFANLSLSQRAFTLTHVFSALAGAGESQSLVDAYLYLTLNGLIRSLRPVSDKERVYRNPERRLPDLPIADREQIALLHRLHNEFFRRSARDFVSCDFDVVPESISQSGQRTFEQLIPSLTPLRLFEDFAPSVFEPLRTGQSSPELISAAVAMTRFIFDVWEQEPNSARAIAAKMLLAARCTQFDEDVCWDKPADLWLGEPYSGGRDLEAFLIGVPGVRFVAGMYLDGDKHPDHESFSGFLRDIGVLHRLEADENEELYSPSEWSRFTTSLGAEAHQRPGGINYQMRSIDYSWPTVIQSALDLGLKGHDGSESRIRRIKAFAHLLDDAWPRLEERTRRRGYCHVKGAREDTMIKGAESTLGGWLRKMNWVPIRGRSGLFLTPKECFLPTESSSFWSGASTNATIADVEIANHTLIAFLGFSDQPLELGVLERLRFIARNVPPASLSLDTVARLYQTLAGPEGLNEETRSAFADEALVFVPGNPSRFVRTDQVVWRSHEDFEGFIVPLEGAYGQFPDLQGFFTQTLGVSEDVGDVHYLRYFVRYAWQTDGGGERRRRLALKTYRILLGWAAEESRSGAWSSAQRLPEMREFGDKLLFRGSCAGVLGWYSSREKTVVYRDDPSLEELLRGQDNFVLESFLSQIERSEDAIEPFLRFAGMRRASSLVHMMLSYAGTAVHPHESDLRVNLFHLTRSLQRGVTALIEEDDRPLDGTSEFQRRIETLLASAAALQVSVAQQLRRIYRIEGIDDHVVPSDAALEGAGSTSRLFLSPHDCRDVGAELAREICRVLGMEELVGRIAEPAKCVTQDVAGSLDRPVDQFLRVLNRANEKHFPGLFAASEQGNASELTPGIPMSPGGLSHDFNGESQATDSGNGTSHGYEQPESSMKGKRCELPLITDQSPRVIDVDPNEVEPGPYASWPSGAGSWRHRSWNPGDVDREWEREIGRRAEEIVIEYEKSRLKAEGVESPELKVEHRSLNDHGSPFDVLSCLRIGDKWEPLYIEVKGSSNPSSESFPISTNELIFAVRQSDIQHRVYHVRGVATSTPEIRKLDLKTLFKEKRLHIEGETLRITVRTISSVTP
jgi:hypothetical protein